MTDTKKVKKLLKEAIKALDTVKNSEKVIDLVTNTDFYLFVHDAVGLVEATRSEQLFLWRLNDANVDGNKRTWVENLSGLSYTIGRFGDMPICVSLRSATIDGQKIIFYDVTSLVSHWGLVDEWIKLNFGANINKTDATNFHCAFNK